MSEETAVEQEVTDPVDSLPDQQMDFSSALDKAFEALNQPEPSLSLSLSLSLSQNLNQKKLLRYSRKIRLSPKLRLKKNKKS